MSRTRATPTEAPVESLVRRIKPWQVLAGALVGVVGISAGAATWRASLATKAEVDASRGAVEGEQAAMKLETQALRDRMTRAEVSLEWIKAQLTEVAHATGAHVVPPQPSQPPEVP